ncbi:nucleotidyltransferase domain-containing protein [soil metagenome]
MMDVQAHIKKVCRQIVDRFSPDKVILFGSYAYGTPTYDSDIDLLVVMPYDGNELDKMAEVRRELNSAMPLDVMVKTPKQIETRIAMEDFFVREIIDKGKVLYDAGNLGVGE